MEKKNDLECCKNPNGLPTNENFWDKQYQNNETGWDLNQVSPPLKDYIDALTDKASSILIPGCGNAYEASYLVENGFSNVTVIDISSTLVKKLKEKFSGTSIKIIHGDFFEHKEKYDLILEQTFFCAIDPSLRGRYVNQCYNLLNENGTIAGLLFNIVFEKAGPPFGGNKEEYQKLFETLFSLVQFEVCTNSIKPRQGNELFVEMKKKKLSFENTL